MHTILKSAVAVGFLMATATASQAIPIQGNDAGDIAALNIAGFFDIDGSDTLQADSTIVLNSLIANGDQGYATVDAGAAASSISSIDLGAPASAGAFLQLAFGAFPQTGTDPDFDGVDSGGDFTFTITNANVIDFNVSPVGNDTQTSFELIALGQVSFNYDATPTEEFDEPAFFSLVLNGSSVDGSAEGSFSGTITTPPAFDTVQVSEPGMLAMLGIGGLAISLGARRFRRKKSA